MERESFIFYRSFYEAVKDLSKDIRLEVFTAIMEYALYGRLPENLKPFAKGIFTLIKPNIDVNTVRYENGKKGGRKTRSKNTGVSPVADYDASFEQEVEMMRSDEEWKDSVCADFDITPEEYDLRLSRFLRHCNDESKRKGKTRHDSFVDAQSHLRYWMTKAYTRQVVARLPDDGSSIPFPEAEAEDGFGALDY